MRAFTPFVLVAGSIVVVASCSSSPTSRELVGKTRSAIIGGTTDTTHSAVVAILADAGGNSFDECSGSIVQVKNGVGYVLTAAHCCGGEPTNPNISPSIIVEASDYGPYEADIGNSNPAAPAYPVIPGSIAWDKGYTTSNQLAYDFCMLQFSGASASTPVLNLPTSTSDGLSVGVSVEYVGFGITSETQSGMNNSLRYHVTSTVDQQVTSLVIKYSEGGGRGGPCSGDSGGPALLPAGAAQSSQTVVATTSYGDVNCASYGVSMRVSSETGPNGFITQYLAGNIDAGSSAGDAGVNSQCDSCEMNVTSVNGACYNQVQACENNTDCNNFAGCLNNCAANDNTCVQNCADAVPERRQRVHRHHRLHLQHRLHLPVRQLVRVEQRRRRHRRGFVGVGQGQRDRPPRATPDRRRVTTPAPGAFPPAPARAGSRADRTRAVETATRAETTATAPTDPPEPPAARAAAQSRRPARPRRARRPRSGSSSASRSPSPAAARRGGTRGSGPGL